jgi:hypothetical protein
MRRTAGDAHAETANVSPTSATLQRGARPSDAHRGCGVEYITFLTKNTQLTVESILGIGEGALQRNGFDK